jgi:glutamate-1-semialdehyde aminotransferase
MRGGRGARIWDVDGNEYVDLMRSYGPVVLGHQHPRVEAVVTAQAALGDCQNAPGPVMVELAELLVRTVRRCPQAGRLVKPPVLRPGRRSSEHRARHGRTSFRLGTAVSCRLC